MLDFLHLTPAGLWSEGQGVIHTPARGGMFFLPQQPFMPLGTLRQQLLFPSGETGIEIPITSKRLHCEPPCLVPAGCQDTSPGIPSLAGHWRLSPCCCASLHPPLPADFHHRFSVPRSPARASSLLRLRVLWVVGGPVLCMRRASVVPRQKSHAPVRHSTWSMVRYGSLWFERGRPLLLLSSTVVKNIFGVMAGDDGQFINGAGAVSDKTLLALLQEVRLPGGAVGAGSVKPRPRRS